MHLGLALLFAFVGGKWRSVLHRNKGCCMVKALERQIDSMHGVECQIELVSNNTSLIILP